MQKKVLLIRSAFLGDFCVVFPQLKKFLSVNGLTIDNIHFLIQNPEGKNPLTVLFGNESKISKKVTPIKTGNVFNYFFQLVKARWALGKFDKIVYLNWTMESGKAKFIKTSFLRLLWPGAEKVGFEIKKSYSSSHYVSPFLLKMQQSDYYALDWYASMLPFPEQKRIEANDFLSDNRSKLNIGIYCNSKMQAKIWPMTKYRDIINRLAQLKEVSFFLIGATEDYTYNEILLKQLKEDDGLESIYNIAGKLDVPQTIFFLNSMNLLITNDGFPMHLAALANTPILALFTYREKVGSWDPFITDKIVSIRTDVKCKECSKPYCSNPICITLTPSDIVYNKAVEILNSTTNKREFEVLFSELGLKSWNEE